MYGNSEKMVSLSQKIEQEILSLPTQERRALIDRLIASLNLPTDPDVDRYWADIAEDRLISLNNGTITPRSGKDIFSNLETGFSQ